VELVLEDRATGAGCEVEIAPEDALDAFYHPYAYVSGCAVLSAQPCGFTSASYSRRCPAT